MSVSTALVFVVEDFIRRDSSDENRDFLVNELLAVGIRTSSIHVLREEMNSVSELIRHLVTKVEYVITLGGMESGNLIQEAALLAFQVHIVRSGPIEGAETSRAAIQASDRKWMKRVERDTELVATECGTILRTRNVYSLPGSPRIVRGLFPALAKRLFDASPIVSNSIPMPPIGTKLDRIIETAVRKYSSVTIRRTTPEREDAADEITISGISADDVRGCISFVEAQIRSVEAQKN